MIIRLWKQPVNKGPFKRDKVESSSVPFINDWNEIQLDPSAILAGISPGTELLFNFLNLHGPSILKEKWRAGNQNTRKPSSLFLLVIQTTLVGRSTC